MWAGQGRYRVRCFPLCRPQRETLLQNLCSVLVVDQKTHRSRCVFSFTTQISFWSTECEPAERDWRVYRAFYLVPVFFQGHTKYLDNLFLLGGGIPMQPFLPPSTQMSFRCLLSTVESPLKRPDRTTICFMRPPCSDCVNGACCKPRGSNEKAHDDGRGEGGTL